MTDFTSALYLDMRHASHALPHWDALTEGVPAALREAELSARFEGELATLQGVQTCLAMTSTLHAFWDLAGWLARPGTLMLADSHAYRVAFWGLERALARRVPVCSFRHHDPASLTQVLKKHLDAHTSRPVVFVDGVFPDDGRVAPIADYLSVVRAYNGLVVVDDTQALGVLGRAPSSSQPYGAGGGGSLAWLGLEAPDVIAVASCAKAFGVPIAAISGSQPLISTLRGSAQTRVHNSPPSNAHLAAGLHAMALNRSSGDARRARLLRNVLRFKERLAAAGVAALGALFPVQTLDPGISDPLMLFRWLESRDVSVVLRRTRRRAQLRLSFLLTARHTADEIDRATQEILLGLRRTRRIRPASVLMEPTIATGLGPQSRCAK